MTQVGHARIPTNGAESGRALQGSRGRPGLTLVSTWAVAVLASACHLASNEQPEAWIEIRGQRVWLEVADTPEEQRLGLGERDSLAWNHGMYFEYANPGFYAFWMKGMRFPIDIIWLRDDHIIDLDLNVPFEEGGNGPTLRPRELADAVLEVPAGTATALGWRIGDSVKYERVRAN